MKKIYEKIILGFENITQMCRYAVGSFHSGPSYAHFTIRYNIGTHAAGWDKIELFSSSAAQCTWSLCILRNIFCLLIIHTSHHV